MIASQTIQIEENNNDQDFKSPVQHLIIDFSCVNFIDSEGVACLKQVTLTLFCLF
jgi:hypothetical protein